jgi:hypothetical protein
MEGDQRRQFGCSGRLCLHPEQARYGFNWRMPANGTIRPLCHVAQNDRLPPRAPISARIRLSAPASSAADWRVKSALNSSRPNGVHCGESPATRMARLQQFLRHRRPVQVVGIEITAAVSRGSAMTDAICRFRGRAAMPRVEVDTIRYQLARLSEEGIK